MVNMKILFLIQLILICHVTYAQEKLWEKNLSTLSFEDASFSPDGKYIGIVDYDLSIYETTSGNIVYYTDNYDLPLTYSNDLNSIRFIDNNTIISHNEDNIIIYDFANDTVLHKDEFLNFSDYVFAIDVASDKSFYIYTNNNDLGVKLVEQGEFVKKYTYENSLQECAISNDNQYIAAATNNGRVLIWSYETDALIYNFRLPTDDIRAIRFTSNSEYLLVGTDAPDKSLTVYSLEIGEIYSKKIFDYNVESITLTNDNSLLGLVCNYGDVQVLEFDTDDLLFEEISDFTSAEKVIFSNDNNYMAVCGSDIVVYDISSWTNQENPINNDLIEIVDNRFSLIHIHEFPIDMNISFNKQNEMVFCKDNDFIFIPESRGESIVWYNEDEYIDIVKRVDTGNRLLNNFIFGIFAIDENTINILTGSRYDAENTKYIYNLYRLSGPFRINQIQDSFLH